MPASSPESSSQSSKCAHKACKCDVQNATAVTANGQRYCGERCVDGRGCDHADCNCGAFPEAEPEDPQREVTPKG